MFSDPVNWVDQDGLLPDVPQGLVDFAAGFGDALTFGLTDYIREKNDLGSVNKCSSAYGAGEIAGTINGLALGGGLIGQGAKTTAKVGYNSTGRVITKNGVPLTIRGKMVSPHAIEQAVKRGVPAKEILKALDTAAPKLKQSLGELSHVRKGSKAIVTTKQNDTIITTIIGRQRPQF